MEPDLKQKLDETYALERDNNRMLRAIRRDHWLGFIWKIIFWAVLIIAPFYLYQQYVQPFMQKFSSTPGAAPTGLFGLPTSADLQKLINSFKAGAK